jgi:surface protein
MFNSASAFNSDVSSWNVSNVKNMTYMFSGTSAFNNGGQPLLWGTGTSNVTNMSYMFTSASSFNQDI